MIVRLISLSAVLLLVACAREAYYDPLKDYEQLDATMILDAPTPIDVAAENREAVSRGEYLVELLGCGACHTDGALIGEPDADRSLAGSRIGIAYTSPLQDRYPGVVYAPNITPDEETGIGRWSDQQIANAVRAGLGRHGARRILVMPWQGYAQISNEDVYAIVGYLRNIKAVRHRVPDAVPPGTMAGGPYVHFGIYRTRGLIIE
jgi:mono/diheme cytochrome c family protein